MSRLDETALQDECTQAGLPWQVHTVAETASTNDDLRLAARRGLPHGTVLFAESQTAGRGRRDNRWITPPGLDLMFSLLLRPTAPMPLWPRYTTLAALALCRAVEAELPLQPQIKWPNDVYVHGKKTAGLLAEAVDTPQGMALILGIGLNVNSRSFPPELADTATSLILALPAQVQAQMKALDRQPVAFQVLRQLAHTFEQIDLRYEEAVAEVRQRSWLLGKQVRATVDGTEIYGRVLDLNPEGHLLLALPDGSVRPLASAESVRQVLSSPTA